MKQITMREFAALCRSDPDLYSQMVAIPKTITPEKVFSLASRNGYQIVPEQPEAEAPVELLDDADLDRVTGGVGALSQEEQWNALHTWIYYVMGYGDGQQTLKIE